MGWADQPLRTKRFVVKTLRIDKHHQHHTQSGTLSQQALTYIISNGNRACIKHNAWKCNFAGGGRVSYRVGEVKFGSWPVDFCLVLRIRLQYERASRAKV